MTDRLRAAIVGLGATGLAIAEALAQRADCEFVTRFGIFEPDDLARGDSLAIVGLV